MKVILTPSFEKIAAWDFNRKPSFLPEEDSVGQDSLFNVEKKDKESILKKWKKNRSVPTKKIYQLGLDVPDVKR